MMMMITHGRSGGGRTTPIPKVRPPLKGQKKRGGGGGGVKMGFGLLEVAGPPPRAWDGFGHPIPAVGGGQRFDHTQTDRGGGSRHPLAKNGVTRLPLLPMA
jgi:hypothetical protein